MISRRRMKIDLIGQSSLLLALIITMISSNNAYAWSKFLIFGLLLWQITSACSFYFHYEYKQKKSFLVAAAVIILSIYILPASGKWFYIALLGLVGWYFFRTISDTIVVVNRPRHFWDLFP